MITKLPKQTEEDIQRLIDTGEYSDSTDVVVQGVRLLSRQRKETERIRALVQIGLDEAERGETIPVTPEFRRELRESARRLALSGEPLDPDICG